jgi:ubiquinone/menaquinone biosynthesis C-methylase UbiE
MSEKAFVFPKKLLGGPASYGSFAVEKRIAVLDRNLRLTGLSVLDLGCGNGCYTIELARRSARVCGVDIQFSKLREFRSNITRFQAVAEKLPFASDSFDVITMIEVLEHTDDDAMALRECYRVLQPGGALVLFVPNKFYPMESHPCQWGRHQLGHNIPFVSWLPESLHRRLCQARIYTKRRLLKLCEQAGFKREKTAYMFPPVDHFPLPFKGLFRRASPYLERTPLGVFGVSIFAVVRKPNGKSKDVAWE